ncbi:hypothetical protein EV368DRAFT_39671 [Lentinula lateritia]|uniref:Uncharacterized protein n=1 Tax=Lentinula aff. lateritia TaxID=2804960 RepID=A0ACC1TZT6_9AGAR|nr:hypothetical protein F5876DRAFT_42030 [Lentinula aff. lateritia]KAJ3853070.1 hypothetical protein EV368DRAFT_39671 [Lentinula lateritia]
MIPDFKLFSYVDRFEVIILLGACFLVDFVTADAKTNWAEGATMSSFYVL